MTQFYLFGTEGCHLCEQAEAILARNSESIAFEKKDIIDTTEWSSKYAIRIPVLYHLETHQELGWPFDEIELNQFISKLQ